MHFTSVFLMDASFHCNYYVNLILLQESSKSSYSQNLRIHSALLQLSVVIVLPFDVYTYKHFIRKKVRYNICSPPLIKSFVSPLKSNSPQTSRVGDSNSISSKCAERIVHLKTSKCTTLYCFLGYFDC